jgi:hypothetical protein
MFEPWHYILRTESPTPNRWRVKSRITVLSQNGNDNSRVLCQALLSTAGDAESSGFYCKLKSLIPQVKYDFTELNNINFPGQTYSKYTWVEITQIKLNFF